MIKIFINDIDYSSYILDTPSFSCEFEEGKIIGNAPSVCFSLSLDNSNKTFDTLLNNDFVVKDYATDKQVGVFTVVEKPERITSELSLKLYDHMIDTNVSYNTDTSMYPTSIAMQIVEMEKMLGKTIDTTELGNTVLSYPAEWYDNTLSIRYFLCFIAELGACNLFCAADGNYKFKKINKLSVHQLPISNVENVDVIEDFKCTRVLLDNGAIIPLSCGDTTRNTVYLSKDNSYVVKQEQVDYIYSIIGGIEFKTIENMTCVEVNDLQLGDISTFNGYNFMTIKYSHELLSGEFGIQNIDGNLIIKNAELVTQHIEVETRIRRLTSEFDQEKLKWSVTAEEVSENSKKITSLELSDEKISQSIISIKKELDNIDTSLYHADIASSGTSITRDISSLVITAKLLNGSTEIEAVESSFIWKRVSSNTSDDATWNNAHKGKKSITITSDDLEASANFYCEVTTAEWNGNTSSITIVDEVKSQVPIGHLTANQPDTQTLDESGNVTPAWGLTLTPSIQLGIFSPDIEDFTTTWKRRVESEEITELVASETVTNNVLSVNTNVLSNDVRSITYYCYIKYQYSTCMVEKTFTLVKDGNSGSDGVSIVRESTTVLYAVNNSNTVPPTTGWITTQPSRSAGQYIWQKIRIAYSDGTQTETDAACITGDRGDKGEDGLNGLQGPKGDQGIQGPIGATGKSSYTHIAYANSADGGTDFSVSDSNRTYVGMYVDSITTDSTDPTKYAWSKIKGADGAQGTPGKAGADGKTPYLHIAYANNATGTSGFSTTDSVNKLYIGQYTDFVSADSSDPTKYAWSKIKGETGATGPQGQQGLQGIQGPKGDQGVKGATGANGQTSYFHIKYSPVQNPTSAQMTETPSTYIGTYVDFIATDSTNPSAYTWTQFKGSQGPKGDQGIAGSNGSNGQTSYLHIAYSNSSDGSQGFSVSDANNKLYIGQYTDFLSADSTDYKKYSWTKIKGEDGTIKSSTEPSDKTKMWLDTSVTPNILKYWNGTLWVMANNQITDINGAVNNATNEINKTIEKTNEKVDKLNSSVSTITETVNKQSGSISETSKKVSELEQTVDGWKSSITKISTIEDKLTGAVMQKELSVYLRFYEESGSPVVNLGSSESKTQNFITNEGMRVEVNGVMQTIINSAGLNTNQIITKKILFENNHAMYTNAAKQLIIQ